MPPYIAHGLDQQGRQATGRPIQSTRPPDDEFGDEHDDPMDLEGAVLFVIGAIGAWLVVAIVLIWIGQAVR